MLKLQELKLYFKYIHKQLPSYLLNWQVIPNINIHNYNYGGSYDSDIIVLIGATDPSL